MLAQSLPDLEEPLLVEERIAPGVVDVWGDMMQSIANGEIYNLLHA